MKLSVAINGAAVAGSSLPSGTRNPADDRNGPGFEAILGDLEPSAAVTSSRLTRASAMPGVAGALLVGSGSSVAMQPATIPSPRASIADGKNVARPNGPSATELLTLVARSGVAATARGIVRPGAPDEAWAPPAVAGATTASDGQSDLALSPKRGDFAAAREDGHAIHEEPRRDEEPGTKPLDLLAIPSLVAQPAEMTVPGLAPGVSAANGGTAPVARIGSGAETPDDTAATMIRRPAGLGRAEPDVDRFSKALEDGGDPSTAGAPQAASPPIGQKERQAIVAASADVAFVSGSLRVETHLGFTRGAPGEAKGSARVDQSEAHENTTSSGMLDHAEAAAVQMGSSVTTPPPEVSVAPLTSSRREEAVATAPQLASATDDARAAFAATPSTDAPTGDARQKPLPLGDTPIHDLEARTEVPEPSAASAGEPDANGGATSAKDDASAGSMPQPATAIPAGPPSTKDAERHAEASAPSSPPGMNGGAQAAFAPEALLSADKGGTDDAKSSRPLAVPRIASPAQQAVDHAEAPAIHVALTRSASVVANSAGHVEASMPIPQLASALDAEPSAPSIAADAALKVLTPNPFSQGLSPVVQQVAEGVAVLAGATMPEPDAVARLVPHARTMALQLSPAGLGTISLRLHVSDRALDVHLVASDGATAALLNHDHGVLAEALRGKDYQLQSLSITAHDATLPGGNHAERGAEPRNGDERPPEQARSGSSGGGSSDGRTADRQPRGGRREERSPQPRAEHPAVVRRGSSLFV